MQPSDPTRGKTSNLKSIEPENAGANSVDDSIAIRKNRIQRYLIAGTIGSFFCLLLAAAVPEDPEVTWLLGFSRGRLALTGIIGLGCLSFLGLTLLGKKPFSRLVAWLIKTGWAGGAARLMAGIGLFTGLYFLIRGLNLPDFWFQPAQVRLAPFMLWVALLSMLTWAFLSDLGVGDRLPLKMKEPRGLLTFFSLMALSIIVLSGSLYISSPELENAFIDEDALIENLTAALFLWTGIVVGLFFRKNPHAPRITLLISVLAFWAFIEEISFGERIFDLEMPYLGGEKFDGLHDLFFLAYESLRIRGLLPWVLIGTALLVLGLWRGSPGINRGIREIVNKVRADPVLFFFALSVGFIATSFILDLEFLEYQTGYFLEELAEFLGALALGFSGLSMEGMADQGEERSPFN